MSAVAATTLQDKLNSIERNAYDGIDFSQEVTDAYVLADELGECIDQLSAENAKLRDERDRMYKANVEKNGEILRLLEENAKLRKLVKDLNKWLWNGADCTECPFTAKCDLNAAFESDLHSNICIGWSEIHDCMRELGIEVDE